MEIQNNIVLYSTCLHPRVIDTTILDSCKMFFDFFSFPEDLDTPILLVRIKVKTGGMTWVRGRIESGEQVDAAEVSEFTCGSIEFDT